MNCFGTSSGYLFSFLLIIVIVCNCDAVGNKNKGHMKYAKHLLPALMLLPTLLPLAAPQKHHTTKGTRVIHVPHHYPVHIPVHKHTTSYHTAGTHHVEGKHSYGAGKHKLIMVGSKGQETKYLDDHDDSYHGSSSHSYPRYHKKYHKFPKKPKYSGEKFDDKSYERPRSKKYYSSKSY